MLTSLCHNRRWIANGFLRNPLRDINAPSSEIVTNSSNAISVKLEIREMSSRTEAPSLTMASLTIGLMAFNSGIMR